MVRLDGFEKRLEPFHDLSVSLPPAATERSCKVGRVESANYGVGQ